MAASRIDRQERDRVESTFGVVRRALLARLYLHAADPNLWEDQEIDRQLLTSAGRERLAQTWRDALVSVGQPKAADPAPRLRNVGETGAVVEGPTGQR